MATGVGMGFDVSQLTKAMDKLDKQLESMLAQSDKVQKNFKKIFDPSGIQWDILNKIDKLKSNLTDLSKTKDPLKWDSKSVSNYIDQVNRLVRTINVLNGAVGFEFFSTKDLEKTKSEFKKLLTEVKSYEKQAWGKTTSRQQTYSGSLKYSDSVKTLEQERQAIINLEAARDKLKKSDADYASKLETLNKAIQKHEQNIRNASKTDAQRAEEAKRASDKIIEASRRERKEYETRQKQTMNKWYSSNASRALKYSSNAKTLEEETRAVKYLEAARAKLDKTDKDYQSNLNNLNARIRQHKKNIDEATKGTTDLQNKHKGLMDTAGQLQRAFAAIFSVSAIKGYVNKLVAIRGEFEMQQRSLQVLLQNKDEANELWDKTIALAVKSPLTTKQLVTYTKQLAAYRIESDKLYETNRMLADVSQGLGVDMNRLILAFGQVKAANFLRGTELRQFSEAGVNMLDELAKRFTMLEGRAVSVGEVFERVSKRMVSFKDVEAVFKSITSEGGIFYQMQEKQSETLKGQMLNLKDSYELMLNEIGKSNEGKIKGVLSFVKSIVENWESVAMVLNSSIAALGAYKLMAFAAKKETLALAESFGVVPKNGKSYLTIVQLLTVGLKRLWSGIKSIGIALKSLFTGNPITLLVLGLATAVYKLYDAWSGHKEQIEEINKSYDELKKKVSTISVKFLYSSNDKDKRSELQNLIDVAKKDLNIDVNIDVHGLEESKIEPTFNALREKILDLQLFAKDFAIALQKATEWTIQDDIFEDFDQFSKAASNLSDSLRRERDTLVDYLNTSGKMSDAFKEALKPKGAEESELEYITRLTKAYEDFFELYNVDTKQISRGRGWSQVLRGDVGDDAFKSIKNVAKSIVDLKDKQKEAEKEFYEFAETVNIPSFFTEEQRTVAIKAAIDKAGFDEFERELAYRLAEQQWGVTITPSLPEPKKLQKWQEEYNKFVATLPSGAVKEMTVDEQPENYINVLKGIYESYANDIKAWDANNAKARAQYSKDDINRIKAENAERKKAIDWLEYDEKKTKKEQTEYLALLNKQLSALKDAKSNYKDLLKYFSSEEAAKKTSDAFAGLFGELDMTSITMDMTFDDRGIIDAIEEIPNKAGKAGEQAKEKLKAEIQAGLDVDIRVKEDNQLLKQIQDMFSGYELSIELDKLNIPHSVARDMFGVETFDLSQIRDKIQRELDMASGVGGKEDRVKELKKQLEQVEKMERDHQEKLLKQYSKYLLQSQSERVKIKLDEIRQLQEIESLNISDTDKDIMRKGVEKETQKALQNQEWKDFQDSDMYIRLFENLETASSRSIKTMKAKLLELRESLKDLDPANLKALNDQIEKLGGLEAEKNPFQTLASSAKEYFEFIKNRKQLETGRDQSASIEKMYEKEVDAKQLSVRALEDELDIAEKVHGKNSEQARQAKEKLELEKAQLKVLLAQLVAQGKITQQYADEIQAGLDAGNATVRAFNKISNGISGVVSAMGDMATNLENAFGMSDKLKDAFGVIQGIGGGVADMFSGAANLMSGNPFQMIQGGMQAIGGIAKVFSAFNENYDKKKERQIQKEIKLVERLGKQYDDLSEKIEKAYSIDTFKAANEEATANLEAQYAATQRMIEAEKDKKKTDWERIKEFQEQQEEILKQMKEQEEQRLQAWGGIGGEDYYKDATQAFVDAWLDAFRETGDGLSALEDEFDNMLMNIAKSQLALRFTDKFLAPIYRSIDEAVKDSDVTQQELQSIREQAQVLLPQLNDALKEAMESMDMTDVATKGADLSGLSAGIQGVSEETADILASYLNSIRLFTSDNNLQLTKLVELQSLNNDMVNPMLSHLKTIVGHTDAIKSAIESVLISANANSITGTCLKVKLA